MGCSNNILAMTQHLNVGLKFGHMMGSSTMHTIKCPWFEDMRM